MANPLCTLAPSEQTAAPSPPPSASAEALVGATSDSLGQRSYGWEATQNRNETSVASIHIPSQGHSAPDSQHLAKEFFPPNYQRKGPQSPSTVWILEFGLELVSGIGERRPIGFQQGGCLLLHQEIRIQNSRSWGVSV